MALKKVGSTTSKPKLKKLVKPAIKEIEKPVVDEEKCYTDLHDVIDYSRDFSMFYSGVEHDAYLSGCYDMGIRNFLMSFEYIQSKHLGDIAKKYPNIHLFVDSGAFTYQNDPKYKDYTVEQWEKQIERYLRWAEKNKENIFAMANLDLENIVGGQKVLEWNKKYFEPFMLRTGIPVCFVWHETTSMTWEQYCQRYPYVGHSAVTAGVDLTLQDHMDLLKTAEKYNSVVHGMGMTRTGMLPQLPYYTVDSTTWKVGFRYGKLIIWNGRTVQQIDKDDWEAKAFKHLDALKDFTYDKELLYQYYEPEVLRVCVKEFQMAEDFIQQQLKPLTYWKKAKAVEVDLNNLPEDFFPDDSWFDENHSDEEIRVYANKYNINPEKDTQFIMNHIMSIVYLFHMDNLEDYPVLTVLHETNQGEERFDAVHNKYVNRIVASKEERNNDLLKFYKETLQGKDTRLLLAGTNFDRMIKERDEYITDEEYESVDVSEMDLNNIMSKYLPQKKNPEDPAPEISELDDEIFRMEGIEPVRDANGRFLKGQKQVLKPKKLMSDKFPKMSCDRCFSAQKCPQYKAGYVCAFNEMFSRYSSRDTGDIIQAMQGITDFSLARLQKGMLQEMMGGGMPDPLVTQMMQQSMSYLQQMQKLYDMASPEVLRQTKVLRADGTQETTTEVTNPQRGGVLEKIFGSMGADENQEDNIVDVVNEDLKDS